MIDLELKIHHIKTQIEYSNTFLKTISTTNQKDAL